VEDDEEVLGVLIDLRALALGEDVLDIEWVPTEALGELACLLEGGAGEMNPGEVVRRELGYARFRRRDSLNYRLA
jgi:hypothetical protein